MFKKVQVMFVLLFLLLATVSSCKKANVSEAHTHQEITEHDHQH